jgi:naphthalene 1,2-dioxygenase system ferredoxin subunit
MTERAMSGEESASATWHSVVDCSAVDSGEAYGAEINGQQIVIFHTEEGFFCTGNLCTHGEAMLSDGLLDGCIVECPLHFSQFDVRTGEALSSPAFIPVSSYPTRIVDEKVEILMPS